jgi:hypothetical protein
LQLNAKENFQRLRKRVNRQEWTEYVPAEMQAGYHRYFNEIREMPCFYNGR